MKFAFSTLGCPEWTWGEIKSAAADLGFDGVEIRGIRGEMYAPNLAIFQPEQLLPTLAELHRLSLSISCLTTACFLFDKENIEKHMADARAYIDLAARIGVPNIRLLGDAAPEAGEGIDVDFVAANLKELAQYAADKRVYVLLENNGVFADSKVIVDVMQKVNHPSAGILWDVHHPFRYFGESAEYTYDMVKPWLRYIHMKDSIMVDGKCVYRMVGDGDEPNLEVLRLLKRDRFNGYVSLEWVKRWNRELTEPGIVFPRFISYVRRYGK